MRDMMEIPKEGWPRFLRSLINMDREQPVRLELASMDVGDQDLVTMLPLQNIELEKAGSAKGSLRVVLGRGDQELTHFIAAPEHIYVRQEPTGEIDCVAILGPGDSKTFMYFQHPEAISADASP